jgi:putative signal transducing protein
MNLHPAASRFFRSRIFARHGSKIAMRLVFGTPPTESRIGDFMPEPQDSAGAPRPDPNEKLVKVFETEQEPEALVVKGLLDSAGIDSDLTSASLLQDAFPGLGGMLILVREEDEDEARRVIAEGRKSSSDNSASDDSRRDDDETAEIPIIEEPPSQG